MIHKYYCVNCGNRFNGEEIKFDLFELIGLRDAGDENSTANPAALIIPGVLKGNADACGQKLVHGKLCPITLSLRTLFTILSVNSDDMTRAALQDCKYDDDDFRNVFESLIKTNENIAVVQQKVDEYVSQIKKLFVLEKGKPDNSDNLSDYRRTFYVKPEFFDNGRSEHIYTLEYADDQYAANTRKIRAPEQIRGYCPKCGKPILQNAGKYPHVLIGLLGAQSAGKTTMILSMLQDILLNFYEHGIELPTNVLCDSRHKITRQNQKLFNNGWLPVKTQETGVNSFNASLLLESRGSDKKLLVTFADIAGEQCYDPQTDSIKLDAVQVFPLINSCDVYILCSCLDNTQYIRADEAASSQEVRRGKRIKMPPQAVLRIADGIYDNLRDFRNTEHKTPPLCIVMTKADVVTDAKAQPTTKNPFDRIKYPKPYFYDSQFTNLSRTYKTFGESKIREPLEWSCKAYDMMSNKAYISIMACSATGRVGDTWTKENEEPTLNENGPFESMGIYDLVDWLFKVIGLSPVFGNYRFEGVPSYRERYLKAIGQERYRNEHYTNLGAARRCEGVAHVFLNPTTVDRDIYLSSLKTKPTPRRFNRPPQDPVLETLNNLNVLIGTEKR